MRYMAEEIARHNQHMTGRAERVGINRQYREQDESHLWPICGRFNVTNRAIRQAQRFERDSGVALYGLEYCYTLESAMSEIVNGAV